MENVYFSVDLFHCYKGLQWEVEGLCYSCLSGGYVPVDFTVSGFIFSICVFMLSPGGSRYGCSSLILNRWWLVIPCLCINEQ